MQKRVTSLKARLVLAALAWVAVAIPIGGGGLALSFRDTLADSFDERLTSLLGILMGSAEIAPSGDIVLARPLGDPRFEQVYSGWYWSISHDQRNALRSRSLWDQELAAQAAPVSATPRLRSVQDALGKRLRVAEQTVDLPGIAVPVTFAIAGDLATLETDARDFNRLLWLSLIALGGGLVLAILAQVSFGLRPLRKVTANIEQVRVGTAQTLQTTGTRELDTLVEEINTLLDQNRRTLDRARANAADLAHALKTPLSVIRSAMSQDNRDDLVQVLAMQRIIDRHLARAASAGPRRGVLTPVQPVIAALVRGMSKIHSERSLTFDVRIEDEARFAGDAEDLEEMLGNLLDNACKWARSRVAVTARLRQHRLEIEIEDDGPGMSREQQALGIERGQRFDESTPGTGLGLAIVSDLAALYEGAFLMGSSPLGGVKAQLQLPAPA
ncbi:MAG TPA: ATP-binding protein [Povalibacter sp.]|nr:ATP-binding protein [Povalibacter sp.]